MNQPILRSAHRRSEPGALAKIMSLDEFRRQLESASQRIGERRRPPPEPAPSEAALDAEWALAQLDEAWEELEVADEELQTQSDQIAEVGRVLDEERQRYRELFDFAPEPYLVTDQLGKITAANLAAAELFGRPASKLEGRLLISFVCVPDRLSFREHIGRASQGTRAERWEGMMSLPCDPPSSSVFLGITAAPDGRGGLLWSLRDITTRRQKEADTTALNAALEQRVLERTRELEASRQFTEELLVREREARRSAEAASREKEEMIALVSHELRSPLHVVIGWARLAMDQQGPARGALEIIERNARAMSALVDDLLDRARILRGGLGLQREPLDLHELLAALCSSFRLGAEARGVSLLVSETARPSVFGDRGRLEQVFTNLLVNALKFTPRGGQISVQLGVEGACAVVHVSDNGVGISPSLLPIIFDGYRQGYSGPAGRRRGLGLGLSIVHHVVIAHDGKVWAVSEGEGCGATFSISLPLLDVSTSATSG
jgi:PAS domain S-box-containing protein